VTEFQQAFDRDCATGGYATDTTDWWLSVPPFGELSRTWDAWSRLLEPPTLPIIAIPGALLRGGGA
jgi:hypothetical protein